MAIYNKRIQISYSSSIGLLLDHPRLVMFGDGWKFQTHFSNDSRYQNQLSNQVVDLIMNISISIPLKTQLSGSYPGFIPFFFQFDASLRNQNRF